MNKQAWLDQDGQLQQSMKICFYGYVRSLNKRFSDKGVGYMNILRDQTGMALVTVVLLGSVAMGLVAVAFYLATSSISSTSEMQRYSVELEDAKGISDYVMGRLVTTTLTCNGGGVCAPDADGDPAVCDAAATVDITNNVCTALGKTGCNNISACFLSQNTSGGWTYYAVNVTSNNPTGGEMATIDFVFRTQ